MVRSSGNGRDASQATAGSQPRIVNAGTIDVQNGKTALLCSSSDLSFNGSPIANSNYTFNSVVARTSTAGGNWWIGGTSGASNQQLHIGWRTNTSFTHAQWSNDYDVAVSGYTATTLTTVTATHSGTLGKKSYLDGNLVGSAVNTQGLTSFPGSRLCRWSGGNFAGYMSKVILFSVDLSTTDRQALQTNQKAYFATP